MQQASDAADLVLLGVPTQAAHHLIMLRALAKRGDGNVDRNNSHHMLLIVAGAL